MSEVKTPVALPPGWIAEADSRGVILTRVDEDGIHLGYATVSEETRGYKLHYLSREITQAKLLSPSQVKAKIKAGWSWKRLSVPFSTAGGAGSYTRALVSPSGEIAFVSDRAEGPQAADIQEQIEVDYTLVRLRVSFEEKDAAKALGAIWVGHKKTWACAPSRAEEFKQWVTEPLECFDLLAS